jgi:hypothetical protein
MVGAQRLHQDRQRAFVQPLRVVVAPLGDIRRRQIVETGGDTSGLTPTLGAVENASSLRFPAGFAELFCYGLSTRMIWTQRLLPNR